MILLTRTYEDSVTTKSVLSNFNINSVIEPMLRLHHYLDVKISYNNETLLLTSVNAIKSLIKISGYRNYKKILAIGRNTADFAVKHGFQNVIPAGETAEDLLQYATENCHDERLLYISGKDISYPLCEALQNYGIRCGRVVVYEVLYSKQLSISCYHSIVSGEISGVMFFSFNTAKTFGELVVQHDLCSSIKYITAYSISEKVSGFLSRYVWKSVFTSVKPTHDALIATVVNNTVSNK